MTPGELRARLAALDPDGWDAVSAAADTGAALTPAAVLIPLVTHNHGMTAIFTRRTEHLNDHAGQVSFPGGRFEAGDGGPVATALREAREEIGLAAEAVEVIGRLDAHDTSTGFSVVPVVGLVAPAYSLTLDSFEVAEAFEVPIAFLFDPSKRRREEALWRGRMHSYYVYDDFGGRTIWGVTARIVASLHEVISLREVLTDP